MKKNDLIGIIIIWLLPALVSFVFKSMYPLLGWIGSTIVSYFIVVYQTEE